MRALFILVLLSNVILFGYLHWFAPPRDDAPYPPYPAPGGLVLLEEESARQPVPDVDLEVAQGIVCFRSPSFDTREAASAQESRDAGDATRSEVREEQAAVMVGHWVYLEAEGSRDEAEERIAELAEAGVDDVGVVTGEPDANAISLGVFSSVERAEDRLEEVSALGFDARIGERQRLETRYYVFAEWPRRPSILPSDWSPTDCQQ